MTAVDSTAVTPVRKSVTVRTTQERAFEIFTAGFDTWWPRSHHIGPSPMKRAIIEGRSGGRCYTEQEDGTECDWGTVLLWDPPRRFVVAWQITPEWKYQPDLALSSEAEVSFTQEAGGLTRVDLEHRHFERHGDGAASMKAAVDSPEGWGGLLKLFVEAAERQ